MRVVRFSVALVFLMAACLAMAVGQVSPLDEAASLASAGLNGNWVNVDPQARGLVRIVVNETSVHPYGACHPEACDWGVLKAQGFASKVNLKDRIALLAVKDTNFDRTVITVSLEADGRLHLETFTHFYDQTGRSDYSTVQYFTRR